MKKRICAAFLSLLLVVLLAPTYVFTANADDYLNEPGTPETDGAMLGLIATDGETQVMSQCFYVENSDGNTYLITDQFFGEAAKKGFDIFIFDDSFANLPELVAMENGLAFFRPTEEGLRERTPLKMGTTMTAKVLVNKVSFAEDDRFVREPEVLDISNASSVEGGYLTELKQDAYVGSPVLEGNKGGLVGILCYVGGEGIILRPLLDVAFPKEAAIVEGSGSGSSETAGTEAPTQPPEEPQSKEPGSGGMSSEMVIGIAAVALIAFFLYRRNKKGKVSVKKEAAPYKPTEPNEQQGTVSLDSKFYSTGPLPKKDEKKEGTFSLEQPNDKGHPFCNPEYQIHAISGPLKGQIFPLGLRRLVIGRRDCDVCLPQGTPGVSGIHCTIGLGQFQDDSTECLSMILEDQNSTYGTYLNGHRISGRYAIEVGDIFSLSKDGPSFRLEKFGAAEQRHTPIVKDVSCCREYSADAREELTFGRDAGNDIQVPDGSVSSHHCKLYHEGGKLYIMDLGSVNGTFLKENERLRPNVPYRIRRGQSFFLVSTKLSFVIVEE